MVDLISSLVQYVEKVWNFLDTNGPQTEHIIIEKTNLKTNELCFAVGWLAKENKISKDDTTYKLGETNLISTIGKDAGNVWKILDMWGEVDIASIARLAKIDESDVFYAVGWLAREDKISGKKPSSVKCNCLFWLK